jgi:hypothetical protein
MMPSRRKTLVAVGALLTSAGCVGELPTAGDGSGTPDGTATRDGETPAVAANGGSEPSKETAKSATDDNGDGSVSSTVVFELHHDERDEQWVLVEAAGVRSVGEVGVQRGQYYVPITLSESGWKTFDSTFETAGVYEDHDAFAIHTIVDGESVHEAGLAPDLVDSIESGEWEGRFRASTATESEAEQLRDRLQSDED